MRNSPLSSKRACLTKNNHAFNHKVLLFLIVSVVFSIPHLLFAQFSRLGTGTIGDPYQVASSTHLNEVRNDMGAYYIQTADIDLNISPYNTGLGWDPIGDFDDFQNPNHFTGTYDGSGYFISNLLVSRSTKVGAGLFGFTSGAAIKNTYLLNVNVTGDSYVGAISGYNQNATISNCSSTGTVSNSGVVGTIGGLTGSCDNTTISGSFSAVTVSTSHSVVGGLVGYIGNGSTVNNCYASGTVTGDEVVGGLIGQAQSSSVTTSYAVGLVTAKRCFRWTHCFQQ